MEQGMAVAAESLSAVASALDVEITDLLTKAPNRAKGPKVHLFSRIRSGEALCNIVADAHMFQNNYLDALTECERDLIAAFLEEAHDIGEWWDEIGPGRCVEFACGLGQSLQHLEWDGLRVFAARVPRVFRIPIDPSNRVPMMVATVVIVREDDPRASDRDTDNERLAVVFAPDDSADGFAEAG
jgi:hypothetical protein